MIKNADDVLYKKNKKLLQQFISIEIKQKNMVQILNVKYVRKNMIVKDIKQKKEKKKEKNMIKNIEIKIVQKNIKKIID